MPPTAEPIALERLFLDWKVPGRPFSQRLQAGVAAVAAVGAVVLGDFPAPGVNLVVVALAMAVLVVAAAWSSGRVLHQGRFNRTGVLFGVLAFALVSVAAFRDAPWIVALCLVLAAPTASYAAAGGRSWPEVLGGGVSLPLAMGRMVGWTSSGIGRSVTVGRGRTWPIARTALIVVVLLLVFGGLFAGADAAFRDVVEGLLPEISFGPMVGRAFVAFVTALVALGLVFLVLAPPPMRVLTPGKPKRAGRWAWAVPIAALDLLFLAFCVLQGSVLLAADKDKLLASTGLTYAEYARQGFFQLVVVTVLVLVVVAFAVRHAPIASRRDRMLVRTLLGALCTLTLVVVAVALRRLYLYEETFGWTQLRLWVHAFELWLGLVIVLVAAAGLKLKASWLPRAVAASGAAGLFALAAINPDAFIAERNVDRFEQTGKIDVYYLGGLSADAVPALDRLPEPQRSCALDRIAAQLRKDRSAGAANLGRHRASEILESRPVVTSRSC
ncbi:DUF4173 domain-containing protein [Spirillospora sp. NPDC047279]|uniref:DUF4153 domain-containing protein n=1 Tax=Spirillospora sp. NPDC047279 TaxID=3155478 RepID=UPI00340DF61C